CPVAPFAKRLLWPLRPHAMPFVPIVGGVQDCLPRLVSALAFSGVRRVRAPSLSGCHNRSLLTTKPHRPGVTANLPGTYNQMQARWRASEPARPQAKNPVFKSDGKSLPTRRNG